MISYCLNCSLKNGLLRKVQLIQKGFFLSFKTGLFRHEKSKQIVCTVFVRKSKGFFTMKTRKVDTCRENIVFVKSRAWFQTGLFRNEK